MDDITNDTVFLFDKDMFPSINFNKIDYNYKMGCVKYMHERESYVYRKLPFETVSENLRCMYCLKKDSQPKYNMGRLGFKKFKDLFSMALPEEERKINKTFVHKECMDKTHRCVGHFSEAAD